MTDSVIAELISFVRRHALPGISLLVAMLLLAVGSHWWLSAGVLLLAAGGLWQSWRIEMTRRESIRRLCDTAYRLSAGTAPAYGMQSYAELKPLSEAMQRVFAEVSNRQSHIGELADRLSTVLRAMMEGVLAVDERQRILFANDAAGRLLGFVAEDAEGKMLLEVVRNHMLHEAVAEALANRDTTDHETQRYEFDSHRSRGKIISFRASRLHGDPCPGVVLVLQDVTDLRRLEHLRQEFIANVSHELKTPLAAIKAFAETLRAGAIDDPGINRKFTASIEEEAERLNDLIAKMLKLAKIESGHEPFVIVPIRLEDALEQCLERHDPLAAQKQLSLRVEATGGKDVSVWADRDGLTTILNNLVDNAIKYTGAGGEVVIRYAALDDQVVRIEVSDSGVGIPAELQPRVFERFYRVETSRSREFGSSGLGLAIVKHLAHHFNGSVSVRSEVDRGSTFEVLLPNASDQQNPLVHAQVS